VRFTCVWLVAVPDRLLGAPGAVVSAGVPVTVTDAEAAAEPPLLLAEQVMVYVWLLVRFERVCVPESATLPLQEPLAAQLVALALVQVRTDEPPPMTDVGFAVMVTVGLRRVATKCDACVVLKEQIPFVTTQVEETRPAVSQGPVTDSER